MRKVVITALVACGCLLAGAVPAQAAPKDPVRALKSELAPGHGVRFTETTTLVGDGKTKIQSRKGTFQFNAKGVAASDITATARHRPRERTISIGKVSYTSGGMWQERLPAGKSWLKSGGLFGGGSGFYGQVINPVEPKTLSALVKKGRLRGGKLTGKITFRELEKVSPWFDASIPLRMHDDTKVSYTLTLNSAGLVSRVTSSYAATGVFDTNLHEGKTITIDSRFTGWGAKVSIKAPAADKVTTSAED
ncbi:hypothetical protein OUY22_19420 [Nonomuraea sp. MCN248]|uniref:Lipoprotein n=1 Tax=Nonomuraea corallina TaxID=2989783 RepID=A0ABT4SF41_9ACTN|nr:hypothetical protein [Nonomuraea corallina]MDA0635595.1 hypothetical protein [Nonomuraea corallina]